ncbi:chemotaxis protein CheA [Pseudoduganella armeniaca]|uniref:Chemotaxis protein CheA n=1 Tax=Pseudoduganella armeniaca TaxID=2072590 RepID=A0A2R4CGC5_9BURK|nr:chemotaxis protein CheA [Pseudoduganella armeniaca]AVR98635.1 chemotaxis protein CheA [Pseudoduganella armeniaca]
MTTVLEQFMTEGRDFVQAIGSNLLALEKNPGDHGLMDELFRVVHTLKGNCGLFDFPDMFRVIHAAEDLMSEVRERRLAYGREIADALLDALDFITLQLDEIESDGQPGTGHGPRSTALAAALAQLAGTGAAISAAAPAAAMTGTPEQQQRLRDALAQVPAAQQREWQRDGAALTWVEYRPEAECFFKGEDPLYHVSQLAGVLWQRVLPAAPWAPLAELDPYQCNLVFQAVLDAPRADIELHFRYVPEQVWLAELPPSQEDPAAQRADAATRQAARQLVSQQRAALMDTSWVAGRVQAAVTAMRNCLGAIGDTQAVETLDTAAGAAFAASTAAPLLAWLDAFDAAPAASVSGDVESVTAAAGETTDARGRRAEDQPGARVLKVEQAKIDRLMNLIGEMVVARNGLPYLAARAEEQYGVRELAREIKAQHGVINRIVEEMQDAIMQVRMTPVSFVFQRFPRLVRDIARRLGKEVELVLEGEATEADKNVIEALADPLVHIVRNSLDHGLESPADRLAAGKPASGRLVIGARQEADRVIIEVSDDGHGIDPARIRRKAYEKGLLDEAALERISDQEAVNLVFLPGFSTAAQVSDLSGRGVGMDAVKSAVEKLNGTVTLTSTAGRGTTLQLALPLSMAVSNVMIVQSGGARYGVPMDLVAETVRLAQGGIRTIKQSQAAVLRNRVVPLHGLNALLALATPQRPNADDELAVLVLRLHGQYVGIVVDDFCDVAEVILKPMNGILDGLTAYAGSALMGDGSVLMVLNPKELLQ